MMRGATPSVTSWSTYGGLWRIDSGFTSTIQIKNRLVTLPVAVTPVLFMADGTEYELPTVTVPASGIANVNVNSAVVLAASAGLVAAHVSQYGSAALRFTGSASAVLAHIAMGSTTLSLSYVSNFNRAQQSGTPAIQTLEGLWWARDAGIGGFVSLSNTTAVEQTITVQAVAADGLVQSEQSVVLAPHANQMLELVTLMGRQLKAGEAGGLRVRFTGLRGEVNVVGGLKNAKEGYSAVIPFWTPPSGSAQATMVTIGHAGIMIGAPDAMMNFPAGTRFVPYLALRNLTAQSIPVLLTLYTEQGRALAGPTQSLQPFESRQVDIASVLQGFNLKDFNGTLSLGVTHSGQASDVLAAAGSVDASGTYVFEVAGRTAEQTLSKEAAHWSLKDGNDTMVSLWNPSAVAEDVVVLLSYGATEKYRFRVHIAPYATANLDVRELIAEQAPDAEGNLIPSIQEEGSFVFHSADGVMSTHPLL